MTAYETILVFSTKLDEETSAALLKRFTDLIEENGTLESVNEWGKRRLAYEIQKETDGVYYLVNFSSSPEFITELERIYRITDGLLRTIVVRRDERIEAAKAATAAAAPATVKPAVEAAPATVEPAAVEPAEAAPAVVESAEQE